jgi:AraC-like DNA-binding protein
MFVLLIELAQELGVTPQRLCAGLGCSVAGLRSGQEISTRQAWRLIRRALQLTGRPDLGLQVGIRQNLSHFGLPGLAMSAAGTMGEAAEICLRYPKQAGGISSGRLEQDRDYVTLTVDCNLHDETVLPFVVEEYFASGLAISRQLVGDRFRVHTLELAYPEPSYGARYRQIFQCPVLFGCARNSARIEHDCLSLPIATHSAATVARRTRLLEQRARGRALATRPTEAVVEQLLLRSGNPRISIDEVAGALQVSVRTLRRRLREDGASFRGLCERIRVESAQRLLREQGMTVAAVAKQLGFSDAPTFRRAFKRWLGQVPGKMRQPTAREAARGTTGGINTPRTRR